LTQPSQDNQLESTNAQAQQLGALDLGSNSFHLLIAHENQGRVRVLDKHKEMVRLAEGLNARGKLDGSVVQRSLDCLERVAQRLRPLQPNNVRIVGTNTLRQAKDAAKFIAQAEAVLGYPIEIISGYEEARLIYVGVCHDLGDDHQTRLVIDIGGGSTELIRGRYFTPETLESLYMGCVSMSQRHFADGKISNERMDKATNEALLELEPIAQQFNKLGWESCIGASGTINTVAAVLGGLGDTLEVTQAGIEDLRARLLDVGNVDKLSLQGLADERRSVFPGGVAILSALFTALDIDTISPSQGALREGLIYDLLGRHHAEDTRDQTVNGLAQRYHIDHAQARQVRDTTMGLLSQVAMDWKLTAAEHNHLLGWAANLHEIGMDISHSGYHKHGGYLIDNSDMPGFSRSNQQQLATLVRGHRRKLAATDITPKSDAALLHIMVLLRIAAVLHRSRSRDPLPHIEVKADKKKLVLSAPGPWLEEHPLTVLDLANEAQYLEAVGIDLSIKTHS
jgi:exopolyphosphatase/guanosine-5'-triphosphate,3'-diphosphate pyrophosphatase